MKALNPILTAVAVVSCTTAAWAQGSFGFTNTVNQVIPDGSPSGLTLAGNISGAGGPISDLTVSLNIGSAPGSTAFNGDLYAYLTGPNGGYSVLLNRPGVGTGNSFGYADTGFNVTFALSGSPANIHTYGAGSFSLNGSGQVTGTWAADGRTVDPLSTPPSGFDPNGNAGLDSFVNANPNGAWVLFLSDASGGNTAEVNSWTLNVTTIPEPSSWALAAAGAVALAIFRRRR